jgi:hypothetical protein
MTVMVLETADVPRSGVVVVVVGYKLSGVFESNTVSPALKPGVLFRTAAGYLPTHLSQPIRLASSG